MDTYDLSIVQGETFSASLIIRDEDGGPMDLTNNLISGYIKTRYGDINPLANLNAQITVPTSGTVAIRIEASGTAILPVNYAFYDIETLNTLTAEVTKVLGGKVLIYPEVTY